MRLLEMIDRFVAFVKTHSSMSREQVEELKQQACEIYQKVYRLDLDRALPKPGELNVEFVDRDPPSYETELNLPGDWVCGPPVDDEGLPIPGSPDEAWTFLFVSSCARWFEKMEMLRAMVVERKQKEAQVDEDERHWNEYLEGKKNGLWKSQAAYARHLKISPAAVTKLKQRVEARRPKKH